MMQVLCRSTLPKEAMPSGAPPQPGCPRWARPHRAGGPAGVAVRLRWRDEVFSSWWSSFASSSSASGVAGVAAAAAGAAAVGVLVAGAKGGAVRGVRLAPSLGVAGLLEGTPLADGALRACGLRGDRGARAAGSDCGVRRRALARAALARVLSDERRTLSDERRTLSDGRPMLMGFRPLGFASLARAVVMVREEPRRLSLAATKLLAEGCCSLALAAAAAAGCTARGEGGGAMPCVTSATEPVSELPVGDCGDAARGTAPGGPAALTEVPAVASSAERRMSFCGRLCAPKSSSSSSSPSDSSSASRSAAMRAAKAAGVCRRRMGRLVVTGVNTSAPPAASPPTAAAAAAVVRPLTSDRVDAWRRGITALDGSSKSGSPVSCRGWQAMMSLRYPGIKTCEAQVA